MLPWPSTIHDAMAVADRSARGWSRLGAVQDPRLIIPGAAITRVDYRVPFYDTDAMGVVHHSNYVRYLELARVRFLEEHDEPYARYMDQGLHVVVTRVDLRLKRGTRFDETLTVTCWIERVKHASIAFSYQVHCGDQLTALASTEHAVINHRSKPVRIPEARRARLLELAAKS
jgi:acyl-CoA thioester hydrolase